MASKRTINLTARDSEILSALLKTPLEARQLLQISGSFKHPFTHERLVRRRLYQLAAAGLVHSYQYATMTAGRVNYYKLTPVGYRLLQGAKATLPGRSFFAPVSLSLQEHTRALAEFIVKIHTTARSAHVQLDSFHRENELHLKLGNRRLQPDCAFQLTQQGLTYNYLVEIDCGTEPIRSTKQRESLEQKIRFYDEYQDKIKKRFRVLVLFTKPSVRMTHFCQTATAVIRDPQRTLFYAGLLPTFLETGDAILNPIFFDRYNKLHSLIPGAKNDRVTSESNANSDEKFVAEFLSL